MAKLDSLTLTGRSGEEYGLQAYTWEHAFKALPAVYVVTERTAEPGSAPAFSPLYVGITDDLSRVFDNHDKSDCFQMYYANTIAVLAEPDAAARARIQQDLVEALQPPCNADEPA